MLLYFNHYIWETDIQIVFGIFCRTCKTFPKGLFEAIMLHISQKGGMLLNDQLYQVALLLFTEV